MKRLKFDEKGISVYVIKSRTTGAEYEVVVDRENISYKIRNINSGRVYLGKNNWTNIKVLQRNLRQHLQDLGIFFEKEEQQRKK
jgi:hypothetical protein